LTIKSGLETLFCSPVYRYKLNRNPSMINFCDDQLLSCQIRRPCKDSFHSLWRPIFEKSIKITLNNKAQEVISVKYKGNQAKADKIVKKSWIYMKRAHLGSKTTDVVSFSFSFLVVWLDVSRKSTVCYFPS